ncbi:6-carboxytetrahydropterin synthase [Synechococcus sp. PCC 6312]|uniref:6-pyruvoyl trahydropterin synthase family protein n=1 Tax=Synechococcus sp. (strain ATCC 27167 / PCC 6312) TaxID=195253 RepID=UPI00029ED247|nr:6-carboxytetrahydropterin synthase [Synechococcus sp. PCC 6312]AFY61262.1 6-pyruvoyl-tetrahydropterin synthase [Synechococcus sp. PCC 6312]
MFRLEIRHNLEMAHRFWQAENSPKCRSIHGHSWQIILTLHSPQLDQQGMVIEFGQLKLVWRAWLDQYLDHALVLCEADPFVKLLQASDPDLRLFTLATDPTTECLAEFLYHQASHILRDVNADPRIQVERIRIEETAVNSAEYWG